MEFNLSGGRELWFKDSKKEWEYYFSDCKYKEALNLVQYENQVEFLDLNLFVDQELGNKLANNTFNQHDLVRLMKFKLIIGTFRPTLLPLVKSNSEDSIKAANKKLLDFYFSNFPKHKVVDPSQKFNDEQIKSLINIFCELKGVGPATSSLICSTLFNNIPFFCDESFDSIFLNEKKLYSMKQYLNYYSALKEKSLSLDISLVNLQRALWSCEICFFSKNKKKRKHNF